MLRFQSCLVVFGTKPTGCIPPESHWPQPVGFGLQKSATAPICSPEMSRPGKCRLVGGRAIFVTFAGDERSLAGNSRDSRRLSEQVPVAGSAASNDQGLAESCQSRRESRTEDPRRVHRQSIATVRLTLTLRRRRSSRSRGTDARSSRRAAGRQCRTLLVSRRHYRHSDPATIRRKLRRRR